MSNEELFYEVRAAIIWAKAHMVDLAPSQITAGSRLSEPPICLDSLEAIAMVTRLEETFGLVAEDEHFFAGSVRTVEDVIGAVRDWIGEAQTAPR